MTGDGLDELRELYQVLLSAPPHRRLELLAAARAAWRAEGARDALQARQGRS